MEFEGLSERTRELLGRQEGFGVDFKERLGAVEDSDLVAFANSERGGAILVGIREERDAEGRQVPVVVGCPVGDTEKQRLVNKAASCVPQIDIEIHIENLGTRTHIFRVEIPSGKMKPYCTGSGRYTIRDDGQTKPLLPPALHAMFMANGINPYLAEVDGKIGRIMRHLGIDGD